MIMFEARGEDATDKLKISKVLDMADTEEMLKFYDGEPVS